MSDRTCSLGGCPKPHNAHGFCLSHERRWKKYGDPLGRPASKRPPDLPGESWLPVPGFEGSYEASDKGRIRGLDRIDSKGRSVVGKLIKGTRLPAGGLHVCLWSAGYPQNWLLHQVILLTFVGPCPPGLVIRHGPNGVTDNSLANLCYGTILENVHDKLRDGTQLVGEQMWNARLTEAAVRAIRAEYAAGGVTQRQLADRYGVSRRTVGKALAGQIWKHVA